MENDGVLKGVNHPSCLPPPHRVIRGEEDLPDGKKERRKIEKDLFLDGDLK